jgi:hypothetical protein
LDLVAGIIEEAAQKAKEGMEEWNGTDRPERKVFFYFIYITVYRARTFKRLLSPGIDSKE